MGLTVKGPYTSSGLLSICMRDPRLPRCTRHFRNKSKSVFGRGPLRVRFLPDRDQIEDLATLQFRAKSNYQAARLARRFAKATLPARVASDIVSKNSDCCTGLFFPAA